MNLGDFDLNLLLALDALLKERNVTRAGQRIGLSQPAMSGALHKLRVIFGDELLVRTGREYRLTTRALSLIEPVQQIISSVEHTIERWPAFEPASDTHTFRIAASHFAAFLIAQPLLARIGAVAPGVTVQIRRLAGRTTLDQLESGELDLGIWNDRLETGLPHQALYSDRWVYAVWSGGRETAAAFAPERYLEMPHLCYDWQANELSDQAPAPALERDVLEAGGSGVEDCILSLFAIRGTNLAVPTSALVGRRLADAAAIRLVDLPFEAPTATQSMFWHPRSAQDPALLWLRDQLTEISAGLV